LPSLFFFELIPNPWRNHEHKRHVYDLGVMRLTYFLTTAALSLLLLPHLSLAQAGESTQQQIHEHSEKAQQYLREKKPELAIPELEALVALDPNSLNVRTNLGVLLFFRGDYAKATPHLRAALQLQPTMYRTQALLGMSEKRGGDFAAARPDLEAAFPQLTEDKLRTETGLELIEIYTSSGDLVKASDIVAVLREKDPTNLTVLYASYRIYSDLAGEAMLSLSIAAPQSAQMHQVMAHELERQGDRPGAIAQYRQALKLDPKLPGLHFELAEVLNASGEGADRGDAEKEYRAALAANPDDEKAECRLGEIAAKQGDIKQSLAHYQHAVQLQPSDSDAEMGLAKAYDASDPTDQNNQRNKALPLLESVIEHDPTNAIAHFRLSTLYRQAGRTEDAKREIEQYKKYKAMKERLGDIYKQMRLHPGPDQASDTNDADAPK
jgi:tetratricopeptide (TPR) repeat protein